LIVSDLLVVTDSLRFRVREESDLGEIGRLLRVEIERVEGKSHGAGVVDPHAAADRAGVRQVVVVAVQAQARYVDDAHAGEPGADLLPEHHRSVRHGRRLDVAYGSRQIAG